MGGRNQRIITDEQAEGGLRRALAQLDDAQPLTPPPDLLHRTLRSLPPVPPSRPPTRRFALGAWVWLMVALIVGVCGVMVMFGGASTLADLLGTGWWADTFRTMGLLMKPFTHMLGLTNPLVLAFASGVIAGAVWFWRRTLKRTPVQVRLRLGREGK